MNVGDLVFIDVVDEVGIISSVTKEGNYLVIVEGGLGLSFFNSKSMKNKEGMTLFPITEEDIEIKTRKSISMFIRRYSESLDFLTHSELVDICIIIVGGLDRG